ncbi:unnamed protein product, partial [Ectocarpus sp. 12 AP-2014]
KSYLSLKQIPLCKFPRAVFNAPTSMILNVFCDGSRDAYGVCAYVTSLSLKSSHLIYSKSKLAKKATIPMIELIAIEYATKVTKRLQDIIKPEKTIIWSDSMLNVHRVHNHPNKYEYRVARRLINISTVKAEIKHIEGKLNPSDYLTKVHPIDRLSEPLWLNGPTKLLDSTT